MPREYSRNQRLGNQLLRTLADLLRMEVKDPRVKGVALTGVDLSRDLSVARVYFGVLDPDEDREAALEGLERATGFLRSRLGKILKVRQVPELRFAVDDSAEEGVRLSALIDDTVSADKQD